ncbi:hypothetical protein GTP45_08700 [Pseudoduganella sp. FT55W]|uniref:EF-hand domain-containing protein n=1 Tax=Duganella rivi TaxID=2666083 RepID=A0A7X4KBF0_9BURK|nr:hypothetical protein [Duganella rivi]MYM66907.1 hypothetical protein [Duganella rivi]
MSTLLPSVRVRTRLRLSLLAMLGGVAQVAFCAHADPRTASVDEVREVHSRIASVFANRDDFPEAPVSMSRLEKKLYWSGSGSDALLLLPLTVRFRGVSNSYCRLVTANSKSGELALIPLPAQANFDDCSGIDQIRYVDVNGDGLLDVIETVKVKSNVQQGQVATSLVYVSSPLRAGGYCYSDAASRQLAPVDMKNDASVAKALESAKQRLGIVQFDCDH